MARLCTPANPLPPWVQFLTDPATLTGADTSRPFAFTWEEMFHYWWNVKNLVTSDGEVIGGSGGGEFSSELDLVCHAVVFQGGGTWHGDTSTLAVTLDLSSVYLDGSGRYWPTISAGYSAYSGLYSGIYTATSGNPPHASDTWASPVLRGSISVLGKGSMDLWLGMPDGFYPTSFPLSASGSVSENDLWSYAD